VKSKSSCRIRGDPFFRDVEYGAKQCSSSHLVDPVISMCQAVRRGVIVVGASTCKARETERNTECGGR
jgi:hypothetical protein